MITKRLTDKFEKKKGMEKKEHKIENCPIITFQDFDTILCEVCPDFLHSH